MYRDLDTAPMKERAVRCRGMNGPFASPVRYERLVGAQMFRVDDGQREWRAFQVTCVGRRRSPTRGRAARSERLASEGGTSVRLSNLETTARRVGVLDREQCVWPADGTLQCLHQRV